MAQEVNTKPNEESWKLLQEVGCCVQWSSHSKEAFLKNGKPTLTLQAVKHKIKIFHI